MRLDLARKVGVHGRLGGRADGNGLLEIGLSALCDPGNFGGEALDVLLLPLEVVRANEDGEVCVADLQGLDLAVEPLLDRLPDGVGCGLEDVAGSRLAAHSKQRFSRFTIQRPRHVSQLDKISKRYKSLHRSRRSSVPW
jgi:hypothetical protein